MLRFFKSLLGGKKVKEPETEAPYKVEAPAPAKCGCGRSQSGYCVGLHKLTPEEWSTHADNPNKVLAEAKPKKKSTGTKKTAAMTAPKKPRAKKEAK